MLTLYHAPSSCALAVHIALEESGLAYQAVRVDLLGGEQTRPEYLALNPKGRVPALATERGVLSETVAILAYVAQGAPGANLAPLDDPFAFAAMQAFNVYLASTVHVAFAHRRRGYRWADDPAAIAEMTRKAPEAVGACFALIEAELFAGPWVMGESYTLADPYLFTFARWLELHEVDPARFPRVLAHRERMGARPSVRKILASYGA